LSMVFYPQTDKQTERVNQELKCIESNRNSIKFFLSTQTWSGFKLSQLKSYKISIFLAKFLVLTDYYYTNLVMTWQNS